MQYIRYLFLAFLISFTALQADVATITSVSPNFGPTTGNTSLVTITGTGFSDATQVQFGTATVPFTIVDDATITIQIGDIPVHVAGGTNVIITNGSGLSLPARYIYQSATVVMLEQSSNGLDTTPSVLAPYRLTADPLSLIPIAPISLADLYSNSTFGNSKVAITPDGAKGYVMTTDPSTGRNPVWINLANNNSVSFTGPVSNVVVPPLSKYAYYSDGFLHRIQIEDDTVDEAPFPSTMAGVTPRVLAATPDGSTAFAADTVNSMVAVDLVTAVATPFSITATGSPVGLAISPDGLTGYLASNSGTATISRFDTTTYSEISPSLPLTSALVSMTITPDGQFLYAATDTSVIKIDLLTFSVVGSPIPLPVSGVIGIVSGADSQTLYVGIENGGSSLRGVIAIYNDVAGSFIPSIDGGHTATAIVAVPDQAPVAVFTATSADLTVSLDASTSVNPNPEEAITNYFWDFGDSQTESTASPTTSHTYATAGTYTVTLTLTNAAGTSLAKTFTGQTVNNNGSLFAQESHGITLSGPTPPPPSSGVTKPRHFHGSLTKEGKKFKLKAHWKKSSSSDVTQYRIYAGSKRIKTISTSSKLQFKRHLYPIAYFLKHEGSFKKHLYRKYSVRAVNSAGQKSKRAHLHVK